MIACRKYKTEDYPEVLSWWEARKIRMPEDVLSSIGSIVPGIAAGFLIRTNTSACIFEPFIANPRASKEDRNTALNAIMVDLVQEARLLGFKRVFGFSSNEPMIERALKVGFQVVEESTTVVKELN